MTVAGRRPAWGRATVRAPATSANLGPGFDSFGLCLDLADVVTAKVVPGGGSRVVVSGEGLGLIATDDANLVVTSMRCAFDSWGLPQPGLRLACRNQIPQGRGLGSSAAAIVAGLRLAEQLTGDPPLTDAARLIFAAQLEGHADNVAACLLGGLTIAWTDDGAPSASRLDVDDRIVPVVLCAERPMSTRSARELLPETVPHGQASANLARAALLVVAMTRCPELLLPATYDLIHQEARRCAMPETLQQVSTLRDAGIAAVVSGAGPSVLALCTREQADRLARQGPPGWRVMRLAVDPDGVSVVPDEDGMAAAARNGG